jgi:Na+/phosphate symporter
MMKKKTKVGGVSSDSEVSKMIKSDLLTGLFVGVILGLVFTTQLAPHLAVIAILAVIFGAKMIDLK